jgi:photosystem II stability/assembly factor-like uncharacterized protein
MKTKILHHLTGLVALFCLLTMSGAVTAQHPAHKGAPRVSAGDSAVQIDLPPYAQQTVPYQDWRSFTSSDPSGYRMGVSKQFEEVSYTLKAIDFISPTLGWAVGAPHWVQANKTYTGTVVVTSDGGETWVAQETGTDRTLYAVDFVDQNNGWAVGAEGTILHTGDGGAHWAAQPVATSDEFRSVSFVDAGRGWVTSVRVTHYDSFGDADDWQSAIWHTADGGTTWVQQDVPSSVSILHDIDLIDAQQGWAVGARNIGEDAYGHPQHRAAVYHTADGGSTWVEQYAPDLEVTLTAVDWTDAAHGWAVGFPTRSSVSGGFVFATADGGETWARQEPGGFFSPLWDVQFVDQERGYVVGADYISAWGPPVWRTQDGGATWEQVKMDRHENDGLYGLAVLGDQVVAVGDHDYVVKSTRAWDSCEWVFPEPPCYNCDCLFEQYTISTHYRFEDVFFVDAEHGWAVGTQSYEPELWGQVIVHTADGGSTWEVQYDHAPPDTLFSVHRLNSVHFVDQEHGWAVGKSESYISDPDQRYQGAILYTADGGLHWEEQGSEIYEGRAREFFAVHALDGQNVWALAASYFPSENIHLVHTTNGGEQWGWVDTGITGTLAIGFALVQGDLDFPDAQHGWAVGGLGQVIYTGDGGSSWTRQELTCDWPTCNKRLFALDAVGTAEGWIAGEGLYHSTNGGSLWAMQEVEEVKTDLHDAQFVDAAHGCLAGNYGLILYTEDGGASWTVAQNEVSAFHLRGLSFVSPERGWFVGDGGTILTTIRIPYWSVHLPLVIRADAG